MDIFLISFHYFYSLNKRVYLKLLLVLIIMLLGDFMKNGLKNYCEELKKMSEGKKTISDKELQYHYIKIKNYQHERLVHLIITITFAFITLFSLYFARNDIAYFMITLISFVMLICYIMYYYYLENTIQKLYKYYDLLFHKSNK